MKPLTLSLSMLLMLVTAARQTMASDALPPGATFNIVQWEGGALPPRYERTDQVPLTAGDLVQLTRGGFEPGQMVRMLQERRFAGDASAPGLSSLKQDGVAPVVLQAVSLHALLPNRALDLAVELSFEGSPRRAEPSPAGRVPRGRYLYILIPDGSRERVFTADLNAVFSGRWRNDVVIDATDPLLPRQVRRVTFAGEVPLKTYGERQVLVFTSARPDIVSSRDIPEADRAGIRAFKIDYPACSVRRDCIIQVRYRQDAALPDRWREVRSDLVCEWN